MKFSILLPTHNRLEYLKYAIDSVVLQNYENYEIIVSDNFSTQDIAGYIRSLNHPKIKYVRTNQFISVTENWNHCLDHSDGDYTIMLGDDDILMNGYFKTMEQIISDFNSPELIYSNAYLYAYPGVLPAYPNGYLRTIGNTDLWTTDTPFFISEKKRAQMLRETFNFRVAFSFNMQFGTMHRNLIRRIRFQGKFFHSPYPDYYAMVLMMSQAKSVVGCPTPIVTIGISPKSFGFYYYNQKEDEGMQFLNTKNELNEHQELADIVLPGSHMNTCWLFSLNFANKALPAKMEINYARYRRLQIIEYFQELQSDKFSKIITKLKFHEKILYGPYFFSLLLIESILGKRGTSFIYKAMKKILRSHPRYPSREWENKYNNILEVFKHFA